MNQNIKSILQNVLSFSVVFGGAFASLQAQSSAKPAVLHFSGDNNYTSNFNTGIKMNSQLLEVGVQGQATIEFWAKSSGATSNYSSFRQWELTNLLTGGKEFSFKVTKNELTVKLGTQETRIALAGESIIFKDIWTHYSLAFNKNANTFDVYVNGVRLSQINLPNGVSPERLYFHNKRQNNLSIAEFRAWDRLRTRKQINDLQYRSLYNATSSALEEHYANGLALAYVNDDSQEVDGTVLTQVKRTIWRNVMTNLGLPNLAVNETAFTSFYKESDLRLAEVSSELEHPIISLDEILLTASKGSGRKSPNANSKNGVYLKWPHLAKAEAYTISRRDLSSTTASSSVIASISAQDLQTIAVSEDVTYFDTSISPNELYQYTVQAVGSDTEANGRDTGFVFANGEVEGELKTSLEVATQFAKLEAIPNNGQVNPGSALALNTSSSPLIVNDVDLFYQANGAATIEFWYKTPANPTASNTVFELGEGNIQLNATEFKVELNGQTFLAGNRTADNQWHHYAFAYDAQGATLYEDGQPIDGATNTNTFQVNLSAISSFSLNAAVNEAYNLDELRVWKGKRTALEINEFDAHILADDYETLLAYYRFDLTDPKAVYNQADRNLGRFTASSESDLIHLAAADQPQITYVSFTDTDGRYKMTSLNTGKPSASSSGNSLEFRINPSKPNYSFSPVTRIVDLNRILNPNAENASFTDVSSLPVSGLVRYRVTNNAGQDEFYPSIQGSGILLDGQLVTSADPTVSTTTDNQGVYVISAGPGRHTFAVNPVLSGGTESSTISQADRRSLDFDGTGAYANTAQNVNTNAAGFTLSGFFKPDVEANPENPIAAVQTLWSWGALKLELRDNNRAVLVLNGIDKSSITITEQANYNFFAVSYDATSNDLSLIVDNVIESSLAQNLNVDAKLYLGVDYLEGDANPSRNPSRTNLDIIEFRTKNYSTEKIADIKEGNEIKEDKDFLELSYTFEHTAGHRALNLVTKADSNENNYLDLVGDAIFSEASSSIYNREATYDYAASNSDYNPQPNSPEYELNVVEAMSNVNFENTSRFEFIGNVVVPCDYSVGNWEGKITRTDVAFPEYSKVINTSNFNTDGNIFTVKDLVPGQYTVELTNVDTNRKVQSSTIDLRRANQAYDFSFRNELQAEIVFKNFDTNYLNGDIEAGIGTDVDTTCEDNYILATGQGIAVYVNAYEDYNGNKCYVEGATVSLNGDGLLGTTNNFQTQTIDGGLARFISQAGKPNFLGDYLRHFAVAVEHNGRAINLDEATYITGAEQGNSDFTLVDPRVGFVLHDPVGDGSSSSIARGSSFSHNYSTENGTDVSGGAEFVFGSKVETNTITLAIAAPLGVGTAVGVQNTLVSGSTGATFGLDANFSHRSNNASGYSVATSQAISTPSWDTYVGEDADTFVGMSNVLTFGTGRSFEVNNCTPRIVNDRKVITAEQQSPFIYTKQDILDVLIPNLQRLAISRVDQINGVQVSELSEEELALRNSLDLDQTLENILTDELQEDNEINDYLYQVGRWRTILQENTDKLKVSESEFRNYRDFTDLTREVSSYDESDNLVSNTEQLASLPSEIAFNAGPSSSYSLNTGVSTSSSKTNSGGFNTSIKGDTEGNILGVHFAVDLNASIGGTFGSTNANDNSTDETISFELSDDDAGDQFNVIAKLDPDYGTPIFKTTAGRSSCPFESGTVPREGVEITSDIYTGYGLPNDEVIVYNITLRNTQIAKDATRKGYLVGMNGASNPLGAQVAFNSSSIFDPSTTSPITFTLDPSSETGVQKEIKATLTIGRSLGHDGPASYEGIKVRIYSECEQGGDAFRSYRQDEYAEVGVVPFQEITLNAYFVDPCVEEIDMTSPANDWVVNNSNEDKLDFRFDIPELRQADVLDDDFKAIIEYAPVGSNETSILTELTKAQLVEYTSPVDGYINYPADISSLTNGDYQFRIRPKCEDGGADLEVNSSNPTEFVTGTIARSAVSLVSSTPENNGILTEGSITATFSGPINPATATPSTISLRGILGGVPRELKSAKFGQKSDFVNVPHQEAFNLDAAYTIQMWVNPNAIPAQDVPILAKGDNYKVELTSTGNIQINDVLTSDTPLQPFAWTHVTAVYDGANTMTLYYNGVNVGTAAYNEPAVNTQDIEIAKPLANGNSFVGLLDEVRIWNKAVPLSEIVEFSDKQLLGNEDNLQAYFVFDDNGLDGTDGAPDEAIRDYTANAVGTTANGLEFVSGDAYAAPLDITKMVEDIQFRVTSTDSNQTIIIEPVFTPQELEGAKLTAIIHNQKMEDIYGNKISGAEWYFAINRNNVEWSHNNITVNQTQGSATTINNVELSNENGGVAVEYEFVNLPSWISVTGADQANRNFLDAGFVNRDIDFTVAPYLNAGSHVATIYINTYNADSGVQLGVESFEITVNVACEAPNYEDFNQNAFFDAMYFKANLLINQNVSLDTNDRVAVYLNEQLRGSANVGNNGIVNLAAFGNPGEQGNLTFKVWDASECTEYQGIIENYNFQLEETSGTNSRPATFTVTDQLSRRISIVEGYQDISFNVRDNNTSLDISLTSIKGLSAGDILRDRNDYDFLATADQNGVLVGNTRQTIDVRGSYSLYRASGNGDTTIHANGLPVAIDINIPVKPTRNYIAFLPNELQRASFALRSLTSTTAVDGDVIRRSGLSATYDGSNWVGSLTHLTPGFGYTYIADQEGILNYSGLASAGRYASNDKPVDNSYLDRAAQLGWEVDANDYPNFMYVNAVLHTESIDVNDAQMIAAFVDGKLAGVAKPELIDDQYHYFLGVGGFQEGVVTFFIQNGDEIMQLDNVTNFQSEENLGTVKTPYILTDFKTTGGVDYEGNEGLTSAINAGEGYVLKQNTPNPFVDHTQFDYSVGQNEFVNISLYNLSGQKVHTFVNQQVRGKVMHTVKWNTSTTARLPKGIYIYKMITDTKQLQRKLIIK